MRSRKNFRMLSAGMTLICICMALNTSVWAKHNPEPKDTPKDKLSILEKFDEFIEPFRIPLDSEMVTVEFEDDDHLVYTGEPLEPKVTVTLGQSKLVLDRDYTVTYTNNQEVGQGKVEVYGKGLLSWKVEKEFFIEFSGQSIVDYALQFVGLPYIYGGTTEAGFDCSGLVQYVYKHFNIDLPRTSYAQMQMGTYIGSIEELQPGDILVFYGGGHVGIYMGNGQFVHAANSGTGIVISSFYGDANTYDHYGQAFYSGRRIL